APNSIRRGGSWMRHSRSGKECQLGNEDQPGECAPGGENMGLPFAHSLLSGEFPDEPDFRFELIAEFLPDGTLRNGDELAHVRCRRVAEVHHDVRVYVGDLRITVAEALESALVHEPARTHTLDLLEDRARARVPFEPRMA